MIETPNASNTSLEKEFPDLGTPILRDRSTNSLPYDRGVGRPELTLSLPTVTIQEEETHLKDTDEDKEEEEEVKFFIGDDQQTGTPLSPRDSNVFFGPNGLSVANGGVTIK